MSTPLVYFVLGAAGSGRREVVADLIAGGLTEADRPLLVTASEESELSETARARLQTVPALRVTAWKQATGDMLRFAPIDVGDATHVFVIADGRVDPVVQLEALHEWLPTAGVELARIIAVIHCRLGCDHPELRRWHEACVHFADVVLLNRREGVPNKWVGEFRNWLRKEHFPCLVEFVKKDEVANPALVLAPETRRMSLYFDEVEEWPEPDDEDDEAGIGDDQLGRIDPYIERLASGRRARELPDIGKLLESENLRSKASDR